jgi:hypothetical protein
MWPQTSAWFVNTTSRTGAQNAGHREGQEGTKWRSRWEQGQVGVLDVQVSELIDDPDPTSYFYFANALRKNPTQEV